ncbi:MAG: hypothetical protein WDO15_21510 [Bacteroidota bacterium]
MSENPTPHRPPGSWKAYLLEFILIFLAVMLGFFAESYRESLGDKEKEEQYVRSLMIDLQTDVINIEAIQKHNADAKIMGDSLFYLLSLSNYSQSTNSIYFLGRSFSNREFFYMADGTLKQLNNAGGLRLIRHQDIVDSLQAYQFTYARVVAGQELKEVQLLNYRDVMCKVFDVGVFETMATDGEIIRPKGNPKLLSDSKVLHNELLMRVNFVKRNNALLMGLLDQLKLKSIELQKLIRSEYGKL